MNRSSSSSTDEKPMRTVLWGCELNQEKRTCTFKPQVEGKQDCKLSLRTICLGEKAKEEMNRVEILPPATPEDKKSQPVTIASLQASVLPMVTMMGLELSPPVTFQLRAGSGPVFLSGQECHETSDLPWEEEEEEEEAEAEEEEEEEDDEDDEVSLEEESPVKPVKRPAPQKQTSAAKKKKLEKEEEAMRSSLKEKSPVRKVSTYQKWLLLVGEAGGLWGGCPGWGREWETGAPLLSTGQTPPQT
ncbi:PREDICTED: nucleoplasmin-2 [Galeopterus variegatus]|uniref:Nucleoplasmin-2 n=1 Tax=Galeopterus variegatus TaxID=482537 RepID=A0ABM0R3Z2_GALVR|nr:PREDICTED: nucleoplasmin-2 [Galeopterus variegatus]